MIKSVVSPEVIVQMEDIVMSFSGNVVLDRVNYSLRQGEIHSLMGANGAGKSTLIKILNGIYHQVSGEIKIAGKVVKIKSPKDVEKYGIAFVHQELNVCPDMTVAENMFIGNWAKTSLGLYDRKQTSQKAQNLLELMGIELDPDCPVRKLRTAEKQIIEILKLLHEKQRLSCLMSQLRVSTRKRNKNSLKLFIVYRIMEFQ